MAIQGTPQIIGRQHPTRPAQDLGVSGGIQVLAVRAHRSQIPRTIQRTGVFLAPTISRAPAPSLDRITRLAFPAPSLSIASNGSPSAWPVAVKGCTSSSRQPFRLACFTVDTA